VAKQRQAEPARAQAGTLDEENRLFEAGISAERRGDVHGAGSFFEQLLSHYPGSPLAADAQRALARMKRGSEREK
jgi:TolA-binding protein